MSVEIVNKQNEEFAAQWFGARTLNDNQVVKSTDIESLLSKSNKTVKKSTDLFYENNLRVANVILKKLGKLTNMKIRVVSKQRKNGYLFIVFSVDGVVDFPTDLKQRNGIRITKHGSKEYHLFVGDLNVNG